MAALQDTDSQATEYMFIGHHLGTIGQGASKDKIIRHLSLRGKLGIMAANFGASGRGKKLLPHTGGCGLERSRR
jgi:hypothetical protein